LPKSKEIRRKRRERRKVGKRGVVFFVIQEGVTTSDAQEIQ